MPPVGFKPTISVGERPAAADLLRSWVRIPPGAWIFVCCECRVLSGRGLCDVLITRPEESYRLCCVVVCDLETSRIGAPYIYIYIYDISSLRVNILRPVCIQTSVPIFVIRKALAQIKRVKFLVSGGAAYYTTATTEISHYCIHKTPPLVPVPSQTI